MKRTTKQLEMQEAILIAVYKGCTSFEDLCRESMFLKCSNCNGLGYTVEHDRYSFDSDGDHDCIGCPIQVGCNNCIGQGYISSVPISLPRVLTAFGNLVICIPSYFGNNFLCTKLKERGGTEFLLSRKLLNEDGSDATLFDQSIETQDAIYNIICKRGS